MDVPSISKAAPNTTVATASRNSGAVPANAMIARAMVAIPPIASANIPLVSLATAAVV
jgi:hypothetical protein